MCKLSGIFISLSTSGASFQGNLITRLDLVRGQLAGAETSLDSPIRCYKEYMKTIKKKIFIESKTIMEESSTIYICMVRSKEDEVE